jgi:septal ring factor EnvC (AmiA/AmiB activator)
MSSSRVITILLLLLFLSLPSYCPAQSDAQEAKRKYNAVQKEIKKQKAKLTQVKKKEKKTLTELDKTNKELKYVVQKLKRYKRKLSGTSRRAKTVRVEIAALAGKIEKRKEWLKKRIQTMHRYGKYGDILLVLGASEDFSQALRRWRYLESLYTYERSVLEEFVKDMKTLKSKQADLNTLYSKLKKNKDNVVRTETVLSKEKKKKREILASVRKKKSAYRKMLKDLDRASRNLQQMIGGSDLISGQYSGKGFRRLKGTLPWPVSGKIAIEYGTQEDPTFKTPVFRNGVYIEAKDGSVVQTSHKGKVVYADWFKGYGQLVIVNHGSGYHTLYANLSEIFLKTGDIIIKRARIGKVGSSGLLARPSLYFEIRYKGKPLDPAQWLKK